MNQLPQMKRMNEGKGIRVISLFTGAGGLDLGFDLAGYHIVYASDINPSLLQNS